MNAQKELDQLLAQISDGGKTPRLLLHACCAPCSSYVLEYLSDYFAITVFYYNPNIDPEEEYDKRQAELVRFLSCFPTRNPVSFLAGPYEKDRFDAIAKGLETEPEGGERCRRCYELRLQESARVAKEGGFDYFTTTLSISPYKKADVLNEIGQRLGEACGVPYLVSDFKKKNGYDRSIALSREYNLYRQNYCGCQFSRERSAKKVSV